MSIFLFLLLFFIVPVSPFSSPDRYTKSHVSSHHQEYLELAHPLPSDFLIPSCTHQILRHSFANTINSPPFSTSYSPPSECLPPWSYVSLELRAECRGEQYDRIAGLWLGGAELLRTSTAEPTKCGIFWKVRKDITRYSSLLSRSDLNVTMMLENIVNNFYTGVYHVAVTFLYYKENADEDQSLVYHQNFGFLREKQQKGGVRSWQGLAGLYETPADFIIPISDRGNRGSWFRIESESDVYSQRIRIPRNTYRAVLELYVSFHGNDEFWYSNPPNSYIETNNLTTGRGNGAYREVFVIVDGKFAGSEAPFPVMFTGGVNPLFWEPVVGIGAFNLPSYDFDLTPFLGQLLDGKVHSYGFGVSGGISYWLVNANLHLWVDHKASKRLKARSVVYNSPRLKIKRREDFKLLDGSFKVQAERKAQFGGWVKSSAGNLTTVFSQDYRLKSSVNFVKNGAYKLVKQKVKAWREVVVRNEGGTAVTRLSVRRTYPLSVITSTQPGPQRKKDTYLLVTNVSRALSERYSHGDFSSLVYYSQDSRGWMEVRDHSVLSGSALTRQRFSYRDLFKCYSRSVEAADGKLIGSNTTTDCISSF
ncbi:peptide-N4-(N-acetyl-beta-glucosaminyl)asparagine amidase A [Juglans microcarpa x Juglans regia]|uniref:peptide-N4-(N-acetyl-beta- glucosaminyl)asparagine amidase A n=1 Tax=Juglans microcarpa x Juglans regia TaxID=2249226 RepID=UPI001B7F6D9C|nr:peptide-N4-(N-acetyl-beta-glucosaminyl)asparagine amidase A [Juglans microcarpa x Juglans regia]